MNKPVEVSEIQDDRIVVMAKPGSDEGPWIETGVYLPDEDVDPEDYEPNDDWVRVIVWVQTKTDCDSQVHVLVDPETGEIKIEDRRRGHDGRAR